MIEIVINYNKEKDEFDIYEPSTDTLLISKNLTEALINLSNFLMDSKLIEDNILNCPDISYHLDSWTMRKMIESNVNLLKRLNSGPSGFTIANHRFGGGTMGNLSLQGNNKPRDKEDKSKRKKIKGFSGKSGFKESSKKFGNL